MYALVLMGCPEDNVKIMGNSVNGSGLVVPFGDVLKYEAPKCMITSLLVHSQLGMDGQIEAREFPSRYLAKQH